ncbi:MAG: PEGA domain-containing protein [Deltaproteobacteria bacterium]|nr:PEGA domain-containing protein [Deltaproteobacteria bacterium]
MAQLLIAVGAMIALAAYLRSNTRLASREELERFRLMARRQVRASRSMGILALLSTAIFFAGYRAGSLDASEFFWVALPLLPLPFLILMGRRARRLEVQPDIRSEFDEVCRAWASGLRAGDVPAGGLAVVPRESGMLSAPQAGGPAVASAGLSSKRLWTEALVLGVAFALSGALTLAALFVVFVLGSRASDGAEWALQSLFKGEDSGVARAALPQRELREAVARGRVVFEGTPVSGVLVTAGSGAERGEGTSGNDGTFAIRFKTRGEPAAIRAEDAVGLRMGMLFLTNLDEPGLRDLTLVSAAKLVVVVTDSSGKPLPAAKVEHLFEQGSSGLVPAGKHRIQVSADGYGRAVRRVELKPGQEVTLPVVLEKPVHLSGTLAFEAGAPAALAHLTLRKTQAGVKPTEGEEKYEQYAFTDEAGGFDVELEPGEYDATFPSRGPQPVTRITAPAKDVRLVIRGRAKVSGLVRYGDGVHAEKEAIVRLVHRDGSSMETFTDESGRFEFLHVPAGDYAAFEGLSRVEARIEPEGTHELELIRKEPSPKQLGVAKLTGRLVDERGRPVRATISAFLRNEQGEAASRSTETTADGEFDLGFAVRAPHGLYITSPAEGSARSALSESVRVVPGPGLVITLPSKVTLTGRLSSDAGPVQAAIVEGERIESGTFRLELPRAQRRISIHAEGFATLRVPVPETDAAELDLGAIRLERGRPVSGLVVDQSGAGVSNAFVSSGLVSGAGVTDGAGRFTIAACVEGTATVQARDFARLSIPLSCVDGQRIELKRGSLVRAEVRTEIGALVESATAELSCKGGRALGLVREGQLTIRNAPSGRCTLGLSTAEARRPLAPHDLDIPPSREVDLGTISLKPVAGPPVSVRVTDPIVYGSLLVTLIAKGNELRLREDSRGAWIAPAVAPGEYTVRVRVLGHGGSKVFRRDILVGQEPLDVEISLPDVLEEGEGNEEELE